MLLYYVSNFDVFNIICRLFKTNMQAAFLIWKILEAFFVWKTRAQYHFHAKPYFTVHFYRFPNFLNIYLYNSIRPLKSLLFIMMHMSNWLPCFKCVLPSTSQSCSSLLTNYSLHNYVHFLFPYILTVSVRYFSLHYFFIHLYSFQTSERCSPCNSNPPVNISVESLTTNILCLSIRQWPEMIERGLNAASRPLKLEVRDIFHQY